MPDRTAFVTALLVAALSAWAALTLWVLTADVVAAATLVPLVILLAGLEALVALGYPRRFWPVFVIAAIVNFLPAAVSGTAEELAGIGLIHAAFFVRLILVTRRASKSAPAE
jgi:hypothetical protein